MAIKWIQDNKIVVFSLKDTTRQSVDKFVDEIKTTRENWDASRPFFAIFDTSHSNILLNSYVRARSLELAENAPAGLYGAYAVVVSQSLVGTLITAFFKVFPDKHPTFKSRAFRNFDQAVQWVNNQTQVANH